jgi:PIN domain nuclease of toxin-antitoxin system
VSDLVLDASALLALVQDEPGGERVLHYIAERSCVASSVNIAEVVSRLVDQGGSDEAIAAIVASLDLEVLPFDEQDAIASGTLRRATRGQGLSLGDRACLALARKLAIPAVSADRAWHGLDVGVELEMLR